MTVPIHEMMNCFGDKTFAKCSFLGAILCPFFRQRQKFAGVRAM